MREKFAGVLLRMLHRRKSNAANAKRNRNWPPLAVELPPYEVAIALRYPLMLEATTLLDL
jgi:hypothetical protein